MLKRNGEICRHQVPGFAGRLTETEHAAYAEAIASVDEQLRQFQEAVVALSDLEQHIPDWSELPTNGSTEKAQLVTVEGNKGGPWQVLRILSKSARNEVLFCVRPSDNGREFGVVEKFDPKSAYARVQGAFEILMTSNNPRLLLQDHLENERAILQLFRKDIEASVEESLAEKYPGQNLSRVVRAVGARCKNSATGPSQNNRTRTITTNMRIRF